MKQSSVETRISVADNSVSFPYISQRLNKTAAFGTDERIKILALKISSNGKK